MEIPMASNCSGRPSPAPANRTIRSFSRTPYSAFAGLLSPVAFVGLLLAILLVTITH
jgi:hypothetical protein